ncbi:MAG: hypothetical protein AB1499_02750 [Nitrospirota bacterium]
MPDQCKLLKAEIRRLRKIISGLSPSLGIMLKRRGFTIYRKEPADDLIVPNKKYAVPFYNKLKKYSFRLFLREVIKHQDSFTIEKVARYATKEVSAGYIDFLQKAGIIETAGKIYRLKKRPIRSFGKTLEWFVASLIRNDFHAEATWGVKFKRPKVGGDYDLIAKLDSSLLYMEIKSSPPKGIYDKEIKFFLDRAADLSPDISVFFVDTELRMKDKIIPMFEDELLRRYNKIVRAERILKELFHINRKIFIINAKESISANIETILTFLWHNGLEIT